MPCDKRKKNVKAMKEYYEGKNDKSVVSLAKKMYKNK